MGGLPYIRIDPRPLAADEGAILDHLLSLEFEGVEQLRLQAADATVVGRCDCGCPTIELATNADAVDVAFESRLAPVEGRVILTASDPPADVILFIDDGRISYLELVWYTETPPAVWPPVEQVELFRRSG